MKIYLSHASGFDYKAILYKPLQSSFLWNSHTFILPHEKTYDPINSKHVIESCNLFIAEISRPSTGSGIEMGWAHAADVRILALHEKDCAPSSSIKIVTDEIYPYDDFIGMLENMLK